jgi:hypothetical protein
LNATAGEANHEAVAATPGRVTVLGRKTTDTVGEVVTHFARFPPIRTERSLGFARLTRITLVFSRDAPVNEAVPI